MTDFNVSPAFSFLGKSVAGLVSWPDDPDGPHPFSGKVVGVVVPAQGSGVSLQLLILGAGDPNCEGYEYEIFWDSILSLSVVSGC